MSPGHCYCLHISLEAARHVFCGCGLCFVCRSVLLSAIHLRWTCIANYRVDGQVRRVLAVLAHLLKALLAGEDYQQLQ